MELFNRHEIVRFMIRRQDQMKTQLAAATLLCLAASAISAQNTNAGDVKGYVRTHDAAIFREFSGLLAIPNVHGDVPSLKKNAEYLRDMLIRRGMSPEIWEDEPGAPPTLFAEKLVPGAKRTLLFYIHFDGQPVDRARWKQPDPFVPVLRDSSIEDGGKILTNTGSIGEFPPNWRIYARSAGDDKGPIEAFVSALDAIGNTPSSNVKLILDGAEEGGGSGLPAALKAHRDRLQADVMVLLDGPEHPSGRPTMYYGARGGTNLEVTVYTAKGGMHSGNYGNWMPDANVRLAQLISSMVDPAGKVKIDGFYSDVLPLPPDAVKMIDAVPDDSAAMQKLYGVGSIDGAARSLQEGLNLPTFSVHMMKGGEVGGVIPASATAEIAMRLVPENDPRTMQERVIAHVRKQGYFIVDKDPDVATLASHQRTAKVARRGGGAGGAWRTDPYDPHVSFIENALRSLWGDQLVRLRTIGGGLPAKQFIDVLHVPVVGVAIANFDDNQHTDDENLRLGNLWDGIETLAAILRAK
jgi:acetylornithine deacetylase/succinyl-diaminopimelate desuccinylase-like protein